VNDIEILIGDYTKEAKKRGLNEMLLPVGLIVEDEMDCYNDTAGTKYNYTLFEWVLVKARKTYSLKVVQALIEMLVRKQFITWETVYTDIFKQREEHPKRSESLVSHNLFVDTVLFAGTMDDARVLGLETLEISLSHKQLWHRFLK